MGTVVIKFEIVVVAIREIFLVFLLLVLIIVFLLIYRSVLDWDGQCNCGCVSGERDLIRWNIHRFECSHVQCFLFSSSSEAISVYDAILNS